MQRAEGIALHGDAFGRGGGPVGHHSVYRLCLAEITHPSALNADPGSGYIVRAQPVRAIGRSASVLHLPHQPILIQIPQSGHVAGQSAAFGGCVRLAGPEVDQQGLPLAIQRLHAAHDGGIVACTQFLAVLPDLLHGHIIRIDPVDHRTAVVFLVWQGPVGVRALHPAAQAVVKQQDIAVVQQTDIVRAILPFEILAHRRKEQRWVRILPARGIAQQP